MKHSNRHNAMVSDYSLGWAALGCVWQNNKNLALIIEVRLGLVESYIGFYGTESFESP
jgi:hypothetical protein